VAQWLFDDCQRQSAAGKPWFTVWQTLSSHEPFRVPYKRLEQTPVENSFAYVDDAVGSLLDRLKDSEMWRNLLVVIVADHSCNDAGEALPLTRDTYPHIPLVMTGGAVSEPRTVDTYVSQFDIPATLLAQLGLDHSAFHFSRNVMSEAYTDSWSMHTFNNGFVYRDATGSTVYDNQAQAATSGDDPRRTARGKAFLQHLYRYLADLH
jgi:phosphoglycerol transferase MdoB-like AlkP superfamily enzyme